MIVILEGSSCTGKTTLSMEICRRLGWLKIHFPTRSSPEQYEGPIYTHPNFTNKYGLLFRVTLDQDHAKQDIVHNMQVIKELSASHNIIIDRHLLSNSVYRNIHAPQPIITESIYPTIILVAGNNDILLKRFMARRESKPEFNDNDTYNQIVAANNLFQTIDGHIITIDDMTEEQLLNYVLSYISTIE